MRAGTNNWVLATAGTTLQPGDVIRSTNGAHAEVTFFEGSTIELNGETQVSLSEISLSDTGSTTIHLKQIIGNTVSRVKKLTDSASSYEVETQAAVAAVRGSTLDLTVLADGTTIVANVEGDISVTAQGIEVVIPEGMKVTVVPGSPPGQPEPIIPPTPPPTIPVPGPVYNASVNTGVIADRLTANIGETITYTYTITNTGNIRLANITLSDPIVGTPVFTGGDSNSDSFLDPGETWTFFASHVVSAGDASPLVNNASFSVMVPQNLNVYVIHDHAQVTIGLPELAVVITSPLNGATVTNRTINVSGNVGSAVVSGTITINGETHAIAISEGTFNTSENFIHGVATITVTVSDGEQTASDTIIIHVNVPIIGIRVELTWDTNYTDVDSHLIRPGGEFDDEFTDCYYGNDNPDWGVPEVTTDNPSLDQDVTDGYGPENITLQAPTSSGESHYQYKVHYYSDDGYGPTTATVRIWINDVLVAQYSKLLVDDEIWDCAYIEWPSGDVIGSWPAIAITKSAAPLEVYVGDNVTFTYHVSNIGNALLDNVSVTDNLTGVALYQSGDTNADGTLDLTETWVFTSVHTVTAGEVGTLANTATAHGMFSYTEHTVTAQDSASVTVYAVLAITTESPLPGGVEGEAYSQTLTASGGKGTHHWSITAGSLPEGLNLVGDTISGTPTEFGEVFTFTVRVTDDLTGSDTQEFTLTINPGGTPS